VVGWIWSVKSLSGIHFRRWKVNSKAPRSGGRGTDCRRGKWRAGENLGGRFWFELPIFGFVFFWFGAGCRVFWGADGHLARGFLVRLQKDLMAGFVPNGSRFLRSGGLVLVAVIFMWKSFQALESKRDGADGGRLVKKKSWEFRSSRRNVGSFFTRVGSGAGKFSGADGHLPPGFLMLVQRDFVPDEGQVWWISSRDL